MLISEVALIKHNFKGLKCPLPVLKAKRVIKNMEPNEEQVFLCDDPASPIDFKHLCDTENLYLRTKRNKDTFIFKVSKN